MSIPLPYLPETSTHQPLVAQGAHLLQIWPPRCVDGKEPRTSLQAFALCNSAARCQVVVAASLSTPNRLLVGSKHQIDHGSVEQVNNITTSDGCAMTSVPRYITTPSRERRGRKEETTDSRYGTASKIACDFHTHPRSCLNFEV